MIKNNGLKEKILYSVGALGKELSNGMINVYLMLFLTCFIGLNGVIVGFAMCGIKLITIIFDPFMAMLINNTKNGRMGRFRPWILIGSLFNCVVLLAMFIPINGSIGLKYFYYLFLFLLGGITYTAVDLPFQSMIPSLADSTREREGITSIAKTVGGFGGFIAGSGGSVLIGLLSGGAGNVNNYFIVSIVAGALFLICTTIMSFAIKEKYVLPCQTISLKEVFKIFKQNDQVAPFAWSYVLFLSAINIATMQLIYIFIYSPRLELTPHYMIFNIVSCTGQGLAMVFYTLITKKLPSERLYALTFIFAMIGMAGIFGVTFILGTNTWVNVILLSLVGSFLMIANGVNQISSTVIFTDILDYGEYKTGIRSDSVMMSLQSLLGKIAGSVGLLVLGIGVYLAELPTIDLLTNQFTGVVTDRMLLILYIFMFLLPLPLLPIGLIIYKKKYKLCGELKQKVKEELNVKHGISE